MLGWLRAAIGRTTESLQDIAQSLVPAWMARSVWVASASVAKYLHLARTAYGCNSVVYACIRMLATSVPEAPLLAYRRLRDGETEPVEYDHPLQVMIRHPNELMTEYEMVELVETHMSIGGRAFLWKERSNVRVPIALWPLRPDRVGPVYSTSSEEGQRVLAGWSYAMPGSGEKVMIPREDVIAFAFPDPAGETGGIVEGIGPTQVLAREIAADNEATAFVGSLLANYAQPSMVIKTKVPIPDKETARKLKAGFMREFSGEHRGEPALLDADTEIEKLSFTMREMEFKGVRSNAESRICAAFNVPPILVGVQVGLEHATYSNMAQARGYFAQTTLSNRWRRYGDQFTNDLAAEFGDDLILAFDTSKVSALAETRQAEIQPFAEAFGQGAVTINEYRQRVLGLPELDGGDILVLPYNRTTVGNDAQPTRALPRSRRQWDSELRAIQTACDATTVEIEAAIKAEPDDDIPDDIKPSLATRERHSADLERKLAEALSRLGDTVAGRLLAESKALPDVDEIYSDDDNEEVNAIILDGVRAVMPDAVATAASLLSIEMSFNIEWPDVDDALREAGERIVGINQTTKDQIVAMVKQSLELGEHPWQAAERLRESFGFSQSRARTIARTEMAIAYAKATIAAYKEAGVERVRVWDGTDFDAPCRAVHGTTQTMDWYRSNMIQHPNCLTGDAVVLAPNLRATFARWFDGEVIILRTADDDFLTCTPNHPVLTSRGWVAAQDIAHGDYVIRAFDSERMSRLLDPNHNNVPATIEQIADTFRPSGGGSPATMPSSPEAFHGDGSGSDVYVVRANRFGVGHSRPRIHKQHAELAIVWANTELAQLSSVSAADQFAHWPLGSADSVVRGFSKSASAIYSEPLSAIRSGGAAIADAQPVASKQATNSAPKYADTAPDLISRLTGLVTAVQVVDIRRREFSGHVYNLETEQGWYIANSIITHNCTRAVAAERNV